MAEALSLEDFAGNIEESEDVIRYTDYDTLKDLPDFEGSNKLDRVKLWHEPGQRITAIELVYMNPHTKDLTRPGAHICTGFDNDRMQEEVLEMEADEYIEEVRGYHVRGKSVNGVLLRTNMGKYIEVGAKTGQQFKFTMNRGDLVHGLNFGLSSHLVFLGLVVIPVEAMPRIPSTKPLPIVANPTHPIVINRSEYIGAQFDDALIIDDFFQYNVQHHLKRNRFRLFSIEAVFTDQRIYGLNVGYLVKKERKFSSYNFTYITQIPRPGYIQDKIILDEDEFIVSFSGFVTQGYISLLETTTNKRRSVRWGGFAKKSLKFDFQVPHSEPDPTLPPLPDQAEKVEKMVLALRGAFNTGGMLALIAYYVDSNRDRQIRILE